ncbi:hypothetical protein [Tropicimonas marinistellae]|uniref:hypothetical protein n=1 Tax=Tropicimonas marinistellae TaxID=1739787 RepID=UPI00083799D5|nr:hypothetical protein [Tropicimonas marinistellae]
MRIITSIACLLALAACLPGREPPEPPAQPGTPEFVEQQRAQCESGGGRFGTGPGGATRVCYKTPADAGQFCTTGADCEGLCLARSRTCAPEVPMFGCHEAIMENGLRATICLD